MNGGKGPDRNNPLEQMAFFLSSNIVCVVLYNIYLRLGIDRPITIIIIRHNINCIPIDEANGQSACCFVQSTPFEAENTTPAHAIKCNVSNMNFDWINEKKNIGR